MELDGNVLTIRQPWCHGSQYKILLALMPVTGIDHILIDRRRHSSVLDVRSLRAADCDTGHYLLVAMIRERLAVNKQTSQRFHMDVFNLRFAALRDLDAEVEIDSAWKVIKENFKISSKESLGFYEFKKHKP
jgi:hypothetical protein